MPIRSYLGSTLKVIILHPVAVLCKDAVNRGEPGRALYSLGKIMLKWLVTFSFKRQLFLPVREFLHFLKEALPL